MFERQNLTMRMHMRRFTRLTNAFSKKVENHSYAVALHFMYYNFVRVHQTLKVTPAMEEAGLTDRLWDIDDLVALIDANEEAPKKRRPYKKQNSNLPTTLGAGEGAGNEAGWIAWAQAPSFTSGQYRAMKG